MAPTEDGMTSTPNENDEEERLLGSFAMVFSHGLLIVRDRESTSIHDQWDPSTSGINVESDSIYLAVLNSVDGIVEVNFIEGGTPDAAMISLYQGALEVPTGQVVAHDPNDDITAIFYVEPGMNQINVEVDEEGDAGSVKIRFNPASSSS
jgi:hypothetical protein